MKKLSEKFLSLVLSAVLITSSVGFAAVSVFDYDSFSVKSPFAVSAVASVDDGGLNIINAAPLKISAAAKKNTASAPKAAGKIKSFFSSVKDFFAKIFSIFQKQTPAKSQTTTKKQTTTKPQTTTKKSTDSGSRGESLNTSSSFLREGMNALNKVRRSAGVGDLKTDSGLAKAAGVRAKELSRKFEHTRPNGGKFYTVFADCGVTKPNAVAENIAMATKFDNAADIVDVWLESSGHKSNITNGKYTRFGMAWYISGNGKEYAVLLLGN